MDDVLARAVSLDVNDRFRSTTEFAVALGAAAASASPSADRGAHAIPTRLAWRQRWIVAAAALATTVGVVAASWRSAGHRLRGRDAMDAPDIQEDFAYVEMLVGETCAAVQRLAYLLSIPSDMSVPQLRVDPMWDPLRGNPRFQRLLARRPQ